VNADEILDDLRDRLDKAIVRLDDARLRVPPSNSNEAWRLTGKAAGVRLALSYIHDYNRQEQP